METNNISAEEFLKLYANKKIIDVRTAPEYAREHIPGAINIHESVLLKMPNAYLNPLETYYIYCNTGKASYRTCYCLKKLGYRIINVVDGIKNWKGPVRTGPY